MIIKILACYLIVVNALAFVVFGIDKWKAVRRSWRIPERRLLQLAAIGGSVGALAGMVVWRHKTMHKKFVISVPLLLLLHVALGYAVLRMLSD